MLKMGVASSAELGGRWRQRSQETHKQSSHTTNIALIDGRETEGGCENRSKSEEKCDLPGEMPSPRGDGLFASECVPCVVSQL